MKPQRLVLLALPALLLSACASIPEPLEGEFATVSWQTARDGHDEGRSVRWGGSIVETEPQGEQTCFFVLAYPLDRQARPDLDADSPGRFVACKSGFYDPEVYRNGRELTVTGVVGGTMQRKVGNYDYNYPDIAADTVYLWPLQPIYRTSAPYSPWGPWGGYYYDSFWGPGWGPGRYASPVIVVPKDEAAPQPTETD